MVRLHETKSFAALCEDSSRAELQAEWRVRGIATLRAERARRVKSLERECGAIERALAAYREIDVGEVPTVRLRNAFIRLDPARPARPDEPKKLTDEEKRQRLALDLATRPPATRLVNRPSRALALYLTAVYVTHLTSKPGLNFKNDRENVLRHRGRPTWAALAAMTAPRTLEGWFARLRRALTELEKARLVSTGAPHTQGRYDSWVLLNDAGTESVYQVPGESVVGTVKLPAAFFLNGWHLVLTAQEIAMLLAVMEMSQFHHIQPQESGPVLPGVGLALKTRYVRFGISPEVYESGHQLFEYGLVGWNDPMPNRRRGKLSPYRKALPTLEITSAGTPMEGDGDDKPKVDREPYHFYPPTLTAFDRPAFEVVTNRLTKFDKPYRLHELAGFFTPEQLAKSI